MSTSLIHTAYFNKVQKFLAAVGFSITKEDFDQQEGVVEMATENLILRLVPHLLNPENAIEPDAIIIEVDLMLLDLDNREINHDRFLILHQLNAASRLTTGIVACITKEGMLMISKIVPLASLNEANISEEILRVMHAAESLYDGWNHLADLAEENRATNQESDASKITIAQKV